jgi:hypothetical protein
MVRITLVVLAALLLARCAVTDGPAMTEEARCRQTGGVFKMGYCDVGGAGGGGGY